jgi:hypothetical protein
MIIPTERNDSKRRSKTYSKEKGKHIGAETLHLHTLSFIRALIGCAIEFHRSTDKYFYSWYIQVI